MIISHKHKFIFIHCRKVAGSGIKTTLWPLLGDQDIMIGSLNEVMALGYEPNQATKHALWHPASWNRFRKAKNEFRKSGKTAKYRSLMNAAVKERYKKKLFHNPVHSPAENVRKAFFSEWENYYKFCFVRNPFDQALSEYSYQMKNSRRNEGFKHFLRAMNGDVEDPAIVPRGVKRNWSLYTIDDEVAVDFVGRYETLSKDFEKVLGHLGLEGDHPLRQEKVGKDRRSRIMSEWYDDECVELVHSIYGHEIEYFGYSDPV